MFVGAVAFIAAVATYFWLMRRVVYNLFDPISVTVLSVSFSAALLAVLCDSGLVSWDKLLLFSLVLWAYLLGGKSVGAFFSKAKMRQAIVDVVSTASRSELITFLLVTLGVTLVLAILGLQGGAEGDARQEFARLYRPITVFQSGLFLMSLVLLLSPKLSNTRAWSWIILLVVISIPFSGKAVLLPVLYWYGLRLFVTKTAVSLKAMLGMFTIVFAGVGVLGLIAYGASGLGGVVALFTNRLWLSGDVYIYAYQQGALSSIRDSYHVSFLSYMLHPLTSLMGVRGYDKPLGSMLASAVTGADVLTGPNPQLPVLLDYFFPSALAAKALIAFVIGLLVNGMRPFGVALSKSRSRYVGLGALAAAIFCPASGFLDTSQALISLIGIVAITFSGATLELIVGIRPRRAITTLNIPWQR